MEIQGRKNPVLMFNYGNTTIFQNTVDAVRASPHPTNYELFSCSRQDGWGFHSGAFRRSAERVEGDPQGLTTK